MMKKILSFCIILFFSLKAFSQPYAGTIFVESDIISTADSSTLESVTYTGQGARVVFDRRTNSWETINAYLFVVIWNDELATEAIVNPEFETVELARIEAEKYGRHIGQIPYCLRLDVNEIWIHKGIQPFGGGNNSILIHTGQTIIYEDDGILEETLVHEACHTSLDAAHAASAGWLEAQAMDNGFISTYANDFPNQEDVAESFLMWLAVRHRSDRMSDVDINLITEAIPNRLNYFDNIVCDLFPIQSGNTTSLENHSITENEIMLYPNPTRGMIRLVLAEDRPKAVKIYNASGDLVFNNLVNNDQQIDLSEFPTGVYFLIINSENGQNKTRILKY